MMLIDYENHLLQSVLRLSDRDYRILVILASQLYSKKMPAGRSSYTWHLSEKIANRLGCTGQVVRKSFSVLAHNGYLKNGTEINIDTIAECYFNKLRIR